MATDDFDLDDILKNVDESAKDNVVDNSQEDYEGNDVEFVENAEEDKVIQAGKSKNALKSLLTDKGGPSDSYQCQPLERVISESMLPYSEFVIMDRALPRVEDGLKPVQRRVLYSMLEVGVLPDRPYRKSARIVGDCMGKYHPHGDRSIYDTMVRLAQPFNMGEILVDGHGNFGSVDGDCAAAMRYTEAKLSYIALELLRDIEKDTVQWQFNFDDSCKEPVTLPGRFPNLLVNGGTGIAVGLATNMPTHNLIEACNAVGAYIDNNKITTKQLMKFLPAPDFSTGGFILSSSEMENVYETGKGKIYIRSKITIENGDNGKKNIVLTEIPFQVNKASMLQKIAKYKELDTTGVMSAITEIVDESDRNGIRAVIRLKKDAKINAILKILYKYCDVQTTFSANMVAIADGKPRLLSLKEIIKYYVDYQQNVIYNRTNYDLENCLKKEHILEGLLIAIRNIDEVVKIIKKSKSVTDAKISLIKAFDLDEIQAQAILDMRLARLTNLEVNKLVTELNRLRELIKRYTAILKSPELQIKIVKQELMEVAKKYGTPRKTEIIDDNEDFADSDGEILNVEDGEVLENVNVIATPISTLKNVNQRSYNLASKELNASSWLGEIPSISLNLQFNKDIYVFTNFGNCVKIPINKIDMCKFKDKGINFSSLYKNYVQNERVVEILDIDCNVDGENNLVFVTKQGMIKISKVKEYFASKQSILGIKLRANDELIYVRMENSTKKIAMFTNFGYGLVVEKNDIASSGRVSVGIKGVALEKGDFVVDAMQVNKNDAFVLVLSNGCAKVVRYEEIPESMRNRKGSKMYFGKSKDAKLLKVNLYDTRYNFVLEYEDEKLSLINSKDIPITNRNDAGKNFSSNKKIKAVYNYIVNGK